MKKISVIVPAYNVEQYIERCVNSLLKQTHENIEIIVVDDGSKDNTAKIIDDIADKRPNVIAIHQENQGVSVARNVGLERATGDYISFVDADDEVEKDLFSFLLKLAEQNEAEIAGCSTKTVLSNGKSFEMYGTGKIYNCDSMQAQKKLLKGGIIDCAVYAKLYKSEILENVRFAKGIRMQEDRLFLLEAMQRAKRVYIKDVSKYIRYERAGSATSGKFHERWLDIRTVTSLIKERTKNASADVKEMAEYNELRSYLFLYRKLIRECPKKEYVTEKKEIQKYIISADKKAVASHMRKSEKLECFLCKKEVVYRTFLKIYDVIGK